MPGISYNNQESGSWFKSDFGLVSVFYGTSGGYIATGGRYSTVIGVTFYDIPRAVCKRVLANLMGQMSAGSQDILFAGAGGDGGAYRITVPGGWLCDDSPVPCFGWNLCPNTLNDIALALPPP